MGGAPPSTAMARPRPRDPSSVRLRLRLRLRRFPLRLLLVEPDDLVPPAPARVVHLHRDLVPLRVRVRKRVPEELRPAPVPFAKREPKIAPFSRALRTYHAANAYANASNTKTPNAAAALIACAPPSPPSRTSLPIVGLARFASVSGARPASACVATSTAAAKATGEKRN